MSIRVPGNLIDERFLDRRRRSSSAAGMAGGATAGGLFLYRLWVQHMLERELLAVLFTMVAVKMALMAWYHFHD